MADPADTNSLLQLWSRGEAAAGDTLLRRFYDELRGLAAAQLGREWSRQTLQATELVHLGQAIMTCDGTVDNLVDTVFNYPTLSEAYKVAALDAANKMRALERFGV